MFHWVEVLEVFGTLLALLCLSTLILQAACILYNKVTGVSVGNRSGQVGPAAAVAVGDETERSPIPDGTDNPNAEDHDWSRGVPRLDAPRAFGIIFVAAIVNTMLGFLFNKVLRGVGLGLPRGFLGISPVAQLITLPVGLLVLAAMLPTGFGKGVLVALLYLLIWVALGGVVLVVYLVVFLASGGLSG